MTDDTQKQKLGRNETLSKSAIKTKNPAAAEVSSEKIPEKQVPEQTREEKVDKSPTQEPPRVVQKSGGKGLSLFAILLSLGALAGSGLTWYQTQVRDVQRESNLTVGVSEIGAQVSRFGDAISRLQKDQADAVSSAELENSLLQASNSTQLAIRTIADGQEAVQESVLQLSSKLERGVDQFKVEEVAQLLRLANNSVLFGEDIESAVNALELADGHLRGLKDPRFAVVRTEINAELAVLKAVELIDIEAISGQLRVLKSKIKEMPLANEPNERVGQTAPAPEVSSEPITWRSELVKIWRDLIGSISIQRVDQPPKPLLVPEQRYFLNENIGLAISKAELALLQGQETIFQQSLADASQWLIDYFDLSDVAVADTLAQLNALREKPVDSEIPSITGSYLALQSILGGK